MADERSNDNTYKTNPAFRNYDIAYYNALLEFIKGDVLDLGAGAGMFIREYVKKPEVTSILAVDKYTVELEPHEKLTVLNQRLPSKLTELEDSKFDTIVSTEFVEHINREELEPLLEEVKRLLKPDGLFVGSTPNKKVPTTNPYHLYEYTLSELLGIYKNYFTEVEMHDNGQNCTIWKAKM